MALSDAPSPTLELLLADIGKSQLTLAKGLPENAAGIAPRPDKVPRGVDGMMLEAPDKDPNELSAQRWGIIIPDSPAGDERLEAIAALRTLRQSEQDADVQVFRVPKDMTLNTAFEWKKNVLRNERKLPEAERPKYLLILGDLDEVSAELGHVLANGSFVGRIHFDDRDGYEAYAQKVCQWENTPSKFERALAKFFVGQDGSRAIAQGEAYLVNECIELFRRKGRKPFAGDIEDVWKADDAADFLGKCTEERPSVLLSVSHGAGRSARNPWRSPEEQRKLQGALVLDRFVREQGVVTAEKVMGKPFLPGGLWFMFACFGAGTPSKSAFYAWLAELKKSGQYFEPLDEVLQSLPADDQQPFLAALPKAVLANPKGPLGVIGHLDLAWTYGFVDPNNTMQTRAAHIGSCLQVMANGSRLGVAHDALMQAYRAVNDELVAGFDAEQVARISNRQYSVDSAKRARAFMVRNDLRGYVLLGDPAARLPLAGNKRTERPRQSIDRARTSVGHGTEAMEAAVLEVLAHGNRTHQEIAKSLGIAIDELERWVGIYKAAGKEALSRLK